MSRFSALFSSEQAGDAHRQESALFGRVAQVSSIIVHIPLTTSDTMRALQLIKGSLKAFRRSPPPAATPALTSVALLTHIAAFSRTAEYRTCEDIFAVATGAVAPSPSPAATGDSAWSANSAGLVRRSRKADIRMMGQMRAYAEQTRSLASWHERSDSETPEPEEEETEDDDSEAEFLGFSAQRRAHQ